MKLSFLALLFMMLFSLSVSAQIDGEDEVYLNGDYIEAKFKGGDIRAFQHFLTSQLDSSKITKPGKVVFTFTISETGEIKNIRVVEFPYIEMATEIIRVIKLAPNWQPAKRGGKPISINVKFPMTFQKKQ